LDKSKQEAIRFWKIYNGLNFIFITVALIVITLLSTEIVSYFNPKGIIEINNLLKIAVLIPILQAITIPLKQLVLGSNQQREYVKITMIITVISLLLIVFITPIYHVFGVLFSLILTEIVTAVVFYLTIKNNLFVRKS
jgi:O-antigen/teichoic acid export membrane protein